MMARTSGASWSARADFITYAGDADTAGRYTIGSGDLRRRSSTRTSSTTPMTVYHVSALAGGGPDLLADRILAREQQLWRPTR